MSELCSLLKALESSEAPISAKDLLLFVTYAARLKNEILIPQSALENHDRAPDLLPASVRALLATVAGNIPLEAVDNMWSVLKNAIWTTQEFSRPLDEDRFIALGSDLGLCEL